MRSAIGFLLLTAIFLLPELAFCQATGGTVQGLVTAESGEGLAGASITAKNKNTGTTRTVTSDQNGFYRITEVRTGDYEFTVNLPGFTTEVRSGVTIAIGQQPNINFVLKVAGVTDVINVTEEAPIVEKTKSAIGTTISSRQIDDLPLPDRNFIDLAFLSPGITPSRTEATGISGTGSTGSSNTFLIDGLSNDQDSLGDFRGDFSPDAIAEFQVLSSQYTAEYGQATGAVINVLTRSGTNDLHGRASVYYRADSLSSANPLIEEETPFDQTIFSGFLGGPLVKDKTFFFASYEHTFRNDTAVIAVDPATLAALNQSTSRNISQPLREPRLVLKLDHHLNQDQNLTFRYRLDRSTRENAFVGQDAGTGAVFTEEAGVKQIESDQDFAASHTWVISENKLNEARFQFARQTNDLSEVNCPGCPMIIRPSVVTGKIASFPQVFHEDRWEFLDSFSFHVPDKYGDHYFKAGFDYSHITLPLFVPQSFDGIFLFGTDDPFNANDPNTYPVIFQGATGDPNFTIHNSIVALYFQDQWSLNENLTLNLGMRWDYENHAGIKQDKNNFGPRLHFAWDPFGNGSTSIRGGYGKYYDQIFLNVPLLATFLEPGRFTMETILFPGFPDPHAGNGQTIPLPPDIEVFDPDNKTPSKDVVSFGLQRELAPDLAVSADAVFAKGHNLLLQIDGNAPVNGVRPDPNVGLEFIVQTRGRSDYKSLQLGLLKRFSQRYSLQLAYTLADSKTNAFGHQSNATDPNDLDADFGPSTDDIRHTLSAAVLFDGPWGLNIGVRTTAASAPPYNIITGEDANGDSQLNDRPPGVGRNSARGEALWTLNARIAKKFNIQKMQFEVIVEAFNLFNRLNPDSFVGNILSQNFGQPTSIFPGFEPRQVQLGVRLDF